MTNESKLQKHVTFCAQEDNNIFQRGRQAELHTLQFLIDNLNIRSAGDYHVLVNYNMPVRTGGAAGSLEIDLIVITRFGIFLLEVKDWWGVIEATDKQWVQNHKYEHENVFNVLDHKARVFRGNWFGPAGRLRRLGQVDVVGLIILFNGKQHFVNHTNNRDSSRVLDLGNDLIQVLSSKTLLQNQNSVELTNESIQQIKDALFQVNIPGQEKRVRDYQIIGTLSPGHLFEAFEAVHTITKNRRVRIKRYQLDSLISMPERMIEHYGRSAQAVSELGYHPYIVQTIEFFKDTHRPDLFYEVTEFIKGDRLDGIMTQTRRPLPLHQQLNYLEPLCAALIHAHSKAIYHRNLNPETIFVSEDGTIKLGDFDFAKIIGAEHSMAPFMSGQNFSDGLMTAPELRINPSAASPASDIYSLGMLWYLLASLPQQNPKLGREKEPPLELIDQLSLPDAGRALMKQMVARALNHRPKSLMSILEQLRLLRNEAEA